MHWGYKAKRMYEGYGFSNSENAVRLGLQACELTGKSRENNVKKKNIPYQEQFFNWNYIIY